MLFNLWNYIYMYMSIYTGMYKILFNLHTDPEKEPFYFSNVSQIWNTEFSRFAQGQSAQAMESGHKPQIHNTQSWAFP